MEFKQPIENTLYTFINTQQISFRKKIQKFYCDFYFRLHHNYTGVTILLLVKIDKWNQYCMKFYRLLLKKNNYYCSPTQTKKCLKL